MKTIYLSNNQTLRSALEIAEKGSIIVLEPRVYREKVIIRTPEITIRGVGKETVIRWDDYANKIHGDGLEYNTFRTYAVNVLAKNVTMENLTVENCAGDPKNKGQAVALAVSADGFVGRNLTLKSMQDTLFLAPLPDDLVFRYRGFLPDDERYVEGELTSVFINSEIYGSVDYVFGCGRAFFKSCAFINVDDGRAVGYVAAPAHSLKQKDGFTFINCDFAAEAGLKSEVFLARPWRDYGKCSFINCRFGKHISPSGFDRWGDSARNLTARFCVYGEMPSAVVPWAKRLDEYAADEAVKAADELIKARS